MQPLTTIPHTSACFEHDKIRKPANSSLNNYNQQQKHFAHLAFRIIGGESGH